VFILTVEELEQGPLSEELTLKGHCSLFHAIMVMVNFKIVVLSHLLEKINNMKVLRTSHYLFHNAQKKTCIT
jgi:hypothetical protein